MIGLHPSIRRVQWAPEQGACSERRQPHLQVLLPEAVAGHVAAQQAAGAPRGCEDHRAAPVPEQYARAWATSTGALEGMYGSLFARVETCKQAGMQQAWHALWWVASVGDRMLPRVHGTRANTAIVAVTGFGWSCIAFTPTTGPTQHGDSHR